MKVYEMVVLGVAAVAILPLAIAVLWSLAWVMFVAPWLVLYDLLYGPE